MARQQTPDRSVGELRGPDRTQGRGSVGTPEWTLQLIGHADLDETEMLSRFVAEGPESLTRLPGEYVLSIAGNGEQYLISSPFGVAQYYYAISGNRLVGADTMAGVLSEANLPWRWNWTAVADLMMFLHLLGTETLHPNVHRVPPGSTLHFRDGSLRTRSHHTWDAPERDPYTTPHDALKTLNESLARSCSGKPVLSLSGGFDSRVLLSGLLRQGIRPTLLTMGFELSTDVAIVRKIASDFSLPLLCVEIEHDDYFRYGPTIVRLTDGTKNAVDWHTFIYVAKAEIEPESTLVVGTCGEIARSFYLDRGIASLLSNSVPGSTWLFWKAKLVKWMTSRFPDDLTGAFRPELGREFDSEAQTRRLQRLVASSPGGLLEGLDRFYLEHRVPNFYGNGLRLYSATTRTRAPYLDLAWARAVRSLTRRWRLGSSWHRFAIGENCPELLEYPVESEVDRGYSQMHRRARPLYWVPPLRRKRSKRHSDLGRPDGYVHYTNYEDWFRGDPMLSLVRDHGELLGDLISQDALETILDRHQKRGDRLLLVAFLVAMGQLLPGVR